MYGPEGYVSAGQTLRYTAEFENVGEGIAYGVYVTDVLDGNLDDSSLSVSNCRRIDNSTGAESPASFEYRYNAATRLLTVFADNEGEVGPGQGGKFDISDPISGSLI